MNDAVLMLDAGFDIDTEPFLKSMLVCLRAHLLHVGIPKLPSSRVPDKTP